MCGIAGFVGKGDEAALLRMISAVKHRGPDDTGVWLSPTGVGLAHARLSIVDLSTAGHQPMHSKDGSVSIVFNGEIYNFKTLRAELEAKGRTFRSQSDTEVIIQLYEEYGEASFAKLGGMFAFALYDAKNEKTFLLRDRMGEKPLYWSIQNNTLVFASEPKALFEHPSIKKDLNPESVVSFFTYDSVLTPTSIYKNIYKLEAATYGVYHNGSLTTHSYWQPPQHINNTISFDTALAQLDILFKNSVSQQMVADVPVGVFLSGGLDSSLIAYYAQQGRKEPVHTFSIGFKDRSYDESAYAQEVSKALGTTHHEQIVSAEEVRDTFAVITQKLDEPIADPAILPNHILSKFARGHVTVALGGDGGDELFAGYQTFTAEKILSLYRRLPRFLTAGVVKPLVAHLPVSHKYFSLDFKAKQFLRGAEADPRFTHQAWLESFSLVEKETLFTPEYQSLLSKNPYARIEEYLQDVPSADPHLQTQYLYLRTYMQDDILAKVDRAAMYTALEVRAPFLDHSLAEFALSLPWHFKHRGTTGKYILRKLMEGKLPRDIVYRKKHGFGLPTGSWLRHEWRELLTDTLSESRLREGRIFSPATVSTLIDEHVSGSKNHRKKLWALLSFQLWYDAWHT